MKKPRGTQPFFAFAHADIPLKQLYAAKAVHISCGKISTLELQNCTEVLEYDEGRIKIGMGEVQLLIEGDSLVMDTLIKKSVTLHGRIFNVSFIYGDNK